MYYMFIIVGGVYIRLYNLFIKKVTSECIYTCPWVGCGIKLKKTFVEQTEGDQMLCNTPGEHAAFSRFV